MLGPDGITCCFNGYSWNELWEEYHDKDFELCGYPDWGTFGTDGKTCCLDGLVFDDYWYEYSEESPICK